MEDSERLRQHVAKRAARSVPRLPGGALQSLVLSMAAKAGVDPENLRPATDAEMEAKEREIRMEARQRQVDILLARLPPRFRNAGLPRTPAGAKAARWLKDYRQGDRNSLAILGPTGTGKTWIALALARELLATDTVPVTFVTAADLMAALRPTGLSYDIDLTMFGYAVTPVLVIDDLGAEKMSEWTEEQILRLADERSRHLRPTIVTSNNTGPELRERYGDRIVGRLFGGASLIVLDGADRRQLPAGF